MMPVVRINDANFESLKPISIWLGTKTPSETVDRLIQQMMENLGLEHDLGIPPEAIQSDEGVLEFEKTPGLSFTRLISASVNDVPIEKTNWAGLLLSMIASVKAKGLSGKKLVTELQIPTKVSVYEEEGYTHYPNIGISFQGQSAQDAWKEVERLANKWNIPVEIQFQWRENKKALHPGRTGILRSGTQ